MISKEEREINIAELMKDINEQIWRFEQKYRIRPRFLKLGVYMYQIMKENFTTTYMNINNNIVNTFMGLIICDTPAVQDFSVEVF